MRRLRLAAAIVAGALALPTTGALPSAALAQGPGGAFSPGLPPPQSTIPTTTTPTAPPVTNTPFTRTTGTTGGGGLTGTDVTAIAIGALVVLGGISYFIWWDARKRAPVRALAGGPGERAAGRGSKPRAKPRKLSPAERRRRKRGRAR